MILKNDANKLFIVESNEMIFSDVISRIGYPYLYVFNFTTGYARIFSNLVNDRVNLFIPRNAYTHAVNRLYFDNIICSRVKLDER